MKTTTAGAIAGLVAAAVTSGVMLIGRDAGVLKPTLSDASQTWLDERLGLKRRLGDDGPEIVEQAGHYVGSLGLGATYGSIRPWLGFLPGVLAGAVFGAGVYAFGVVGVLPELGVTRGEPDPEPGVSTQRFGLHIVYGAVLGLVTDALSPRPR